MSKAKAVTTRGSEPEICRNCRNYEFTDGPFGEGPDIAYCTLSLIFPTKGDCKRRKEKSIGRGRP